MDIKWTLNGQGTCVFVWVVHYESLQKFLVQLMVLVLKKGMG